jgi:hypothetical protein
MHLIKALLLYYLFSLLVAFKQVVKQGVLYKKGAFVA